MTEHIGDRVAIITGASKGIGAGLVEAYCKIGCNVIANSRAIGESDRPEVHSVAGDIAHPSTAERLVDLALSRFGRIDTLINNAGVFLGDVELITADYVAWYNQQRLMHRLGRIPPAEAETEYYDQLDASQPAGSQNLEGA